jgi:hypothetical protein
MPASVLQSIADKSGKSISDLEAYWKEAEKQADEKGLKDDSKYAYMTAIVKKRAGLKENFSSFLSSSQTAKDFLTIII